MAQGTARHLDRVDDASVDEVDVFAGRSVEAGAHRGLLDLLDYDVALFTGVLGDPAQRLGNGLGDGANADGLVTLEPEIIGEDGRGLDDGRATASDDALFDRGTRCGDRVFDAHLLFLELDLGVRANLDDGHAARELREALLELLAVPLGIGVLNFCLDLLDAIGNGFNVTGAAHDGRVVLRDDNTLCGAELAELGRLEVEAEIRRDDLSAREDRDVLHHGLAAVAEGRSLYSGALEGAAQLRDHEGCEGFALDVLGNHEEGLAGLHNLLEHGQELLHVRDLALVNEHVGVFENDFLAVSVGHEVRGDEALVELHALGEVELERRRRGLLDRDDAVLANLVECLGKELTDLGILRRHGRDGSGLLLRIDVDLDLADLLAEGLDSLLHAALERRGGGTRSNVAQALVHERLGENGCGRRAVASNVIGLGRDFLRELSAEILVRIIELDLASDRHAVVRDGGGTPLLVEDDVAALGAKRHLDGVRELVDAALKRATRLLVVNDFFCHGEPFSLR